MNIKDYELYTKHGIRKKQGVLSIINGQRALAYFEKEKLVGYSTLDEIDKQFKKGNIPEYTTELKIIARD